MSTIPSTIVTTAPRIRYATAFVIDMSSGPMWIGIHSCCSNSIDGSNSSSSPVPAVVASAVAGSTSSERRHEADAGARHRAGVPKYVASETPSSSVYARP